MNKRVIIVGGGVAGLAVAEALDENGLSSVIIEKQETLGGHVQNWACMATDRCLGCFCCTVDDLIHKVLSSERITHQTGYELSQIIRNESKISKVGVRSLRDGTERLVDASALVVAVGFEPFDPSNKVFWGYGRLRGVMTLSDLNQIMMRDSIAQEMGNGNHPLHIAFFQCVGSRDTTVGANYCSQHCCKASLRMAV
ncbi:MAG: heterodisulfide reductase subunit, partial [Thermodesulfobacteriota bacterium]|nr:heterodisulfide reductase subunit [Thermodesulfobacteriota bacterium]